MHNLFLVLSLFTLLACVSGNEKVLDTINKWDSNSIQHFFESASGNKVDTVVLESLGFRDGNTFIAIMRSDKADEVLASIITSGSFFDSKEKKLERVKAAVHNYVKEDAELSDFHEWRWLNRRLCDFWIVPMFSSPRMLLLWARFFDKNHSIEKINDEIDEISVSLFWTYWCISPSALLLQVSTKFNCGSYLDEVIDTLLGISAVEEVVNGKTSTLKLIALLTNYIKIDLIVLSISWVSFYVFAPILCEKFFGLCDLLFNFAIYIVAPVFTIYKLNHIGEKFSNSGLI